TDYWVEILPEVGRLLLQGLFDLVDDIDEFGDEGGLVGGVTVGTGQAALTVLQKMGDGILSANDLLGEATGDGGERLTTEAKAIVAGLREYYHTHTLKQMASDLGEV